MDFEKQIRDSNDESLRRLLAGASDRSDVKQISRSVAGEWQRPLRVFRMKTWILGVLVLLGAGWLYIIWWLRLGSSWVNLAIYVVIAMPFVWWFPNSISIYADGVAKSRLFWLRQQRIPWENVICFRVDTRDALQRAGIIRPWLGLWLSCCLGWVGLIVYALLRKEPMVWVPSSKDGSAILFTGLHDERESFVQELLNWGVLEHSEILRAPR